MKNVRIWFKKDGATRYISHLDLNRVMTRAIQHSKLPVWHTEGFNPHPFITFALPLSLGFRGVKEAMDIRLLEEIAKDKIINTLNNCLPSGIEVYDVTEPAMKAGKIAFGKFDIKAESDNTSLEKLFEMFRNIFSLEKIEVEKAGKKGTKIIDLKPHIGSYTLEKLDDCVSLEIILPAGSVNNINPMLLITALEKLNNIEIDTDITRLDVYNEEMKPFE
ncbi:MAG: TIGR03936 family radical SAM-associated protein [Acutalibacteraceae bacterium]|nr:TIGR03936 family radical SAM-associated protein [Acutalibacteraceae bacterium]